jgi:polysaccharide transporter, PST family
VDRILIGRFYGPTALGLYARAYQVAMMPIEQIRMMVLGVGLAPLSTLQSDPEEYRRFFGRLLASVCFMYMPVTVFCVVHSETIVLLLLGEQWRDAAPLLRVLAVAASMRPIANTFQLLLISSGRSRQYLYWGAVNAACVTAAFLLGVAWGPYGMAWAYAVASGLLLVWSVWYCSVDTHITPRLIIRNTVGPIIASAGAWLVTAVIAPSPFSTGTVWDALASMLLIAFVYCGLSLCMPAGREILADLLYYTNKMTRPYIVGRFVQWQRRPGDQSLMRSRPHRTRYTYSNSVGVTEAQKVHRTIGGAEATFVERLKP